MNYQQSFHSICLDLDGTTLALKNDITPFCTSVLKRLNTQIDILLVSARIPSGMSYIQQKIGAQSQPLICYNGAYVVKEDKVLYDKCLSFNIVEKLLFPCNELEIKMGIYSYNDWFVSEDSHRIQKEISNTKTEPIYQETNATLSTLKDRGIGVHKIMLMGLKENLDKLQNLLINDFQDQLVAYRSNDTIIEIAPNDVSKLDAIKRVIGEKPLAEVMAFGDNFNDIDMLREVGLGVAVANAREAVKTVADQQILSCADDGVAIFLKKYFNLEEV